MEKSQKKSFKKTKKFSTMETVANYVNKLGSKVNEDDVIEKIKDCLDNGGDIDLIFRDEGDFGITYYETMLHLCIQETALERVAAYVLSRGADIAIEMSGEVRHRNAVEMAAQLYNDNDRSSFLFEKLKNRSLELYSSYGLTPLHVDCAIDWERWNDRDKRHLRTADVNAAVSLESPFWPGMTPLLVAAKFENEDLVKRLLDLGADPIARDSKGNTPLHYVDEYSRFYDERLFAFDAKDTFGPFNREYHFHTACRHCPQALEIVKRYLDQGFSPDLPIDDDDVEDDDSVQYDDCDSSGAVGLHLAALDGCADLTQLLLEYGAQFNKEDSKGYTPIDCTTDCECMCLLIEASGSNQDETADVRGLRDTVSSMKVEFKRLFLECVARLTTLSETLVSQKLKDVYFETSSKLKGSCWNEAEYSTRCCEELRRLSDVGLRQVLDGTIQLKVNGDFKRTFGWLDSDDIKSYPIYEKLLRIKIKPKLLEYERRKEKISQAVPKMQGLFQSLCQLPHLCAENILWSMSDEQLDQFLSQ